MDLRFGNCLTVGGANCRTGIPYFSNLIGERLPIFLPQPDRPTTPTVRPRHVEERRRMELLTTNPGLPDVSWAEFRTLEGVSNHCLLHPRRQPWASNHVIIYLEVPALMFDGPPLLLGREYWPGAEWHDKQPLWRRDVGDTTPSQQRKNPNRAELWKLRIDEQMIIIDTGGRVRLLRFRLGQAELVPVDVPFIVDYLCVRASMYTQVRSLEWADRTMERICASHPGRDFRREQAYVKRQFTEARKIARSG